MTDDPSNLLTDPALARRSQRRRLGVLIAVAALGAAGLFWYLHRAPAQDAQANQASDTPVDGKASRHAGSGGAAASASGGSGGGGGRGGGRGAGGLSISVAVAPVAKQDIMVTQNALGTVTPLATVTVQAQVGGVLTQVAFTEGQTIRKGDFLAEIDPRPYQAALDQAKGQLAKDQASLEEAKMDLERYDLLLQKKSIMRQQAEDQKWTVAQNEGAVRVDQAQVDTAQINLAYTHIVSPTDGRIGLRLVDPGNVVQAGGTSANLAVITRMQPMTVVFALPEDSLPAVMARWRSGARLPVQAYDRSGLHLLDSGTLTAIDSQISTATGTINLKATFPNTASTLFPNQFVNVVLRVDELKGATAVPTAAVQRGANGTFVYTLKADNTVSMVPVKLGPADGAVAAVVSGLTPGDRVVVDGADKLRDGMQVNVPQGS